jgi:hypothetical protein
MLFRVTRSVPRYPYYAGSSVQPPYEIEWFPNGQTPQCDRGDDLPKWLKLTLRMPFCKPDCNCVYTPLYEKTTFPKLLLAVPFPLKSFDTTSSDEEEVQVSDMLDPLMEGNAIDMSEEDRELRAECEDYDDDAIFQDTWDQDYAFVKGKARPGPVKGRQSRLKLDRKQYKPTTSVTIC